MFPIFASMIKHIFKRMCEDFKQCDIYQKTFTNMSTYEGESKQRGIQQDIKTTMEHPKGPRWIA